MAIEIAVSLALGVQTLADDRDMSRMLGFRR
jgi:hypothetical protein